LAVARAVSHQRVRAESLAALAPYLDEPQRGKALVEALEAARAVEHEGARSKALSSLAALLPEPLLPTALETSRGIGDIRARWEALSPLGPRLGEAQWAQLLADALADIGAAKGTKMADGWRWTLWPRHWR